MKVKTHVRARGVKSTFNSFTSWLNKQVAFPVCDSSGCRLVKKSVEGTGEMS